MRLLVIGGTVFLGRHIVEIAKASGVQVTTLNRGTNNLPEQEDVERLFADRDGDLSVLRGRTFDAVIDTCGYRPDSVRNVLNALAGSIGTYIFISTISVYGDFSAIGINEEHPIRYTEPGEVGTYGSLKADCEKVIQELLPENSLIVRPGLIAGPFDPTDRFTYWPARFARGGRVAVPARLERFVQFIDVRDLATWVLILAQAQGRGTYIATGPGERLTLEGFFDACEQAVGGPDLQMVRVEDGAFERAGIEAWSELPLWIPASKASFAGVMRLDRTMAVEAGLICRPVTATISDTYAWDQTRDPNLERLAGLTAKKEELVLKNPKVVDSIGRGPLPGAGLK